MSATMILTMVSVLIGFLFFGGAFATFSYKKPPKLVWSLFVCAIFFLTVIPVTLAVFVAA